VLAGKGKCEGTCTNSADETNCFGKGEKLIATGREASINYADNPKFPMADLENRYEDNVKGGYYVDDQCIDCDLCRETAPENFTRQEDGGYSFLFKQPENDEEKELCEEALEGCPVEAIGNDGDDE
jgi:ferredoxin